MICKKNSRQLETEYSKFSASWIQAKSHATSVLYKQLQSKMNNWYIIIDSALGRHYHRMYFRALRSLRTKLRTKHLCDCGYDSGCAGC